MMGDTGDPRVVLREGDVSERAAAARELARVGTWDDLELLVERAKEDLSPSVRLYTAAAAADIACRMRGTCGRARLTRDQATQLQTWVKTFDPGINPSLLMLLSACADQASVDRLGRMLRDPRNGVRAGAATALRRMALSAASIDDELLPAAIDKLLRGKKLPSDAVLELVKLVGDAGWSSLRETVQAAARAVRLPDGVIEEVLQRLSAREAADAWEGLWVSLGADVLEPVEEGGPVTWLVIAGGEVFASAGEGAEALGPVGLEGDRLRGAERGWRMVFAPRVGEPGIYPALQGGGQTWYRVEGKELVSRVEDLAPALPARAALAIATQLAEIEGVAAARSRAIALWRAERLPEALEVLEGLADSRKPRADVLWFLARVRVDAGDTDGALTALDQFLERAGKRARYRKEGEALQAALRS